jgi:hypothetical protein
MKSRSILRVDQRSVKEYGPADHGQCARCMHPKMHLNKQQVGPGHVHAAIEGLV